MSATIHSNDDLLRVPTGAFVFNGRPKAWGRVIGWQDVTHSPRCRVHVEPTTRPGHTTWWDTASLREWMTASEFITGRDRAERQNGRGDGNG